MGNPSQTIRALRRASRHIDRAAQALVASGVAERKELIAKLLEAVAAIKDIQRLLLQANPDCDYHDDKNRDPTPFMQNISELYKESEQAQKSGDKGLAIECLTKALTLEFPSPPV